MLNFRDKSLRMGTDILILPFIQLNEKMNKRLLGFCAATLVGTSIAAQEQKKDTIVPLQLNEVVVSDSRFKLKRENSGKTVIKITAEEMKQQQGKSVAEFINTKSGIEIVGSRGREGAIYGVFARGGRGRQVLITIDGVRVSDPSSFSSEYDLRLLSTANVESIEIIKGASSTLYGTGAAVAVINITTKKTSDRKIAGNFQSSIGTNQTAENQDYDVSSFSNSAQVSGTLGEFTYAAGFSNTYSDGLSAIVTPDNKEDTFSRYSTDIKLGYRFSDAFDVNIYGNQTKVNNSFDESSGFLDADYRYISKQERIGLSSKYSYGKGSLQVNAAYSTYDSEFISAFPSVSKSENLVIDAYHKYNYNDTFYTVLGVNYLQDKIEFANDEDFKIIDPYVNVVYVSDFGLNVNAGARLNNHSEYGTHFVYNVNPSFSFKTSNGYVKVLSSYATSYITPNLNHLFGAFGANPDLKPEEDRTIEGGLEYAIDKKLRVSALYFNRKEENFITFGPDFSNINATNTIDAQGVEVELDWIPLEKLRFNANYTFTERKGDNAIRLPKHKVNTSINYAVCENTRLSLNYALTGKRFDTDFSTFSNVNLDSFSLLDFYVSHQLIPNKLDVFLNASNILNEKYVEVFGFTTKGRNIRVGLNLNL